MQTIEKIVGLTIGVPTIGRPTPINWGLAFSTYRPTVNYNSRTGVVWGQDVATARNQLGEQSMIDKSRYLFFIGDDVTAPGHVLQQLIYRMEHNPKIGIVGGIYCAKSDPPAPLVFRANGAGPYWNWTVGEFFRVTGIGMDCTLIRTDVLKQLEKPWFVTVRDDGYIDGKASSESWTEDLYFCKRVCEETDWEIWADSMIMCEHWQYLGGNQWKTYTLRSDSRPMQVGEVQGKQILDLGCGPQHWNFGAEGQVTRCDIREECEPDFRIDIRQLPFDDDSYDIVFSSHTLEHFGRDEMDDILKEWTRVLKPSGEMRLILPNIEWAAKKILNDDLDWHALNVLYGSQEYIENFHRNGFTPARITEALAKQGLIVDNLDHHGYNMIVTARYESNRAKRSTPALSSHSGQKEARKGASH